jgi:4-amino-4-deoxy-L-arabinose transferase-like glycosyltransferase
VALTRDRWAGLIAVLAFGLNTNILYMQSTPMTEVPMIAAALGAMYYLLKITQEPDKRRWYLWSGLFLSAGCLIRYENWLLVMAAVPLLIYSFLRHRFSYQRIEGTLIYWAYWAFVGAVAWLLWNMLIFGDPLYFQRGEYADASLWAIESPAIGNLPVAFLAYFYASMNTVGPLFLLGVIGGLVYLARTRLRADSVMPYLPLIIFPFFVYMIYAGQRPLRVYEIGDSSLYNIRFGLIMVVPACIFIGYLAARRVWLRWLMMGLVVVGSAAGLFMYNTITLQEANGFATQAKVQAQVATGQWLLENYDGRPLVMESYGNDILQYSSGIPLGNVIYEGSYHMWEDALKNPQDWGEWVIMRGFVEDDDLDADKMWTLHHDSEVFHQYFELAFENGPHSIYQRRDPLPFDRIDGESG